MQTSDFAYLEKSIVLRRLFRGEDEGRAIRDFGINISVKCEMDHVVLVERELFEVRLGRSITEEDRAGLWEVCRDSLHLMPAFRQRNELTPLGSRDGPTNFSEECGRLGF